MAFDRYSARERDGIDVPGGAIDLRGDLYGLWMLVRSRKGDTLSVVDLTARSVVARTVTELGRRPAADRTALPAARAQGARHRRARPGARRASAAWPGGEGGRRHLGAARVGAAIGRGSRRCRGHRYARDPGRFSAAGSGQRFFLQVSSSRNPAWARELAEKIAAAGIKASVVDPANADDVYRVVVGPFGYARAGRFGQSVAWHAVLRHQRARHAGALTIPSLPRILR